MEMINKRIDDMNDNNNRRFDTLDGKVDALLKFKWELMGGTALFSAIVGIAIAFITSK